MRCVSMEKNGKEDNLFKYVYAQKLIGSATTGSKEQEMDHVRYDYSLKINFIIFH